MSKVDEISDVAREEVRQEEAWVNDTRIPDIAEEQIGDETKKNEE